MILPDTEPEGWAVAANRLSTSTKDGQAETMSHFFHTFTLVSAFVTNSIEALKYGNGNWSLKYSLFNEMLESPF